MDLRRAPKQIVYQQVQEYYKRLCDFFSRGHDKPSPTLVLYDDNNPKDKQTVEVYPDKFSPDKMLNEFITWMKRGKPVYKSAVHAICLNRNRTSTVRFYSDMAEEVTHSVIEAKDPILWYDKLPEKINHQSLEALIQKLPKANKLISLNEFFPSLGESRLLRNTSRLKYDKNRWHIFSELRFILANDPYLQEGNTTETKLKKEIKELNWWLSEVFLYLPQIAGDEIVKQHGCDADKVLKEHPDILTATGIELWQKYCYPQLKDFDFDKIFKEQQ